MGREVGEEKRGDASNFFRPSAPTTPAEKDRNRAASTRRALESFMDSALSFSGPPQDDPAEPDPGTEDSVRFSLKQYASNNIEAVKRLSVLLFRDQHALSKVPPRLNKLAAQRKRAHDDALKKELSALADDDLLDVDDDDSDAPLSRVVQKKKKRQATDNDLEDDDSSSAPAGPTKKIKPDDSD